MAPDQTIWLAHGHTGQIMTLDLNGNVLGQMDGRRGRARRSASTARRITSRSAARRDFRRRHAELARAEICEALIFFLHSPL
jgi:hypothetical protein